MGKLINFQEICLLPLDYFFLELYNSGTLVVKSGAKMSKVEQKPLEGRDGPQKTHTKPQDHRNFRRKEAQPYADR